MLTIVKILLVRQLWKRFLPKRYCWTARFTAIGHLDGLPLYLAAFVTKTGVRSARQGIWVRNRV